jgi:HlyD family secretion protein
MTARRWLLILLCAAWCSGCGNRARFDYSGTLVPETANVGSTIGGRVIAVETSDGRLVRKGQVIVLLDASQQRAQYDAALHERAQAAAALRDLLAGSRPEEIARAQAQAAQAQAQLRKVATSQPDEVRIARANVRANAAELTRALATQRQQSNAYARSIELYKDGAISAQARDDALAAYQTSVASVHTARAQLASARAQLAQLLTASQPSDLAAAQSAYQSAAANAQLVAAGPRPQQVAQAKAALAAAASDANAAASQLREMTVRAPADGIINALDLRAGDMVGPRASVAAVREFINPYVRIYVAQKDLGRIALGTQVRVRSDALPGTTFTGKVEEIDQDAQFTPRDVQTAEDRADLVFGVKVRVLDPGQRLHGGTTVEVALP